MNGRYWHSNYWDPLYTIHEELNVTWGFHEGVSAPYSHMIELYGENRFYRHVASHWIEMQQAMIAMIIGGVFEFHPKLRVGFLEAQNSWAPGLLSRIEWDYPQYRDSHAPYLSLTPREYFRRNCWAAVEGSEPEIEATAGLIGADRMCISTDYPHFDSNFPHVSENLLKNVPREIAAHIFMGGAHLYGFDRGRLQEGRHRGGGPEGGPRHLTDRVEAGGPGQRGQRDRPRVPSLRGVTVGRPRAVRAAEDRAAVLHAVPDDSTAAVRARRRQGLDRALEAVVGSRYAPHADLEGRVVVVAAHVAPVFQRTGCLALAWLGQRRGALTDRMGDAGGEPGQGAHDRVSPTMS